MIYDTNTVYQVFFWTFFTFLYLFVFKNSKKLPKNNINYDFFYSRIESESWMVYIVPFEVNNFFYFRNKSAKKSAITLIYNIW